MNDISRMFQVIGEMIKEIFSAFVENDEEDENKTNDVEENKEDNEEE